MAEQDPLLAQKQAHLRELIRDGAGHGMALVIVFGFFGVIFAAMTGVADLKDSTVTGFISGVIGYIVAKLDPIILYYFKIVAHDPKKGLDQSKPESAGQ